MAAQSRKWAILVAAIWIQAFTGTNFDFSAYSSEMKSVLGVSQVHLNYLATASDLGKALGWTSGVALMWLPLPAVMFAAAAMGFVGYGIQWLVITNAITLPYFAVFLLCLLAGCSISWFNTDTGVEKDQLVMLGQEHKAGMLVRRLDFWLYYLAYFCGGTIGLVYSNNLGQIAQSLGYSSMTSKLIAIYSSFSFFGHLLSAAPDFVRMKVYFARTGWLAIAIIPMPVAFLILAAVGGNVLVIQAGTALIGLSSGFIFAAAVSVTSELFGLGSVGVNHNILITNIPIGSLVYGVLAAMVYDSNAMPGIGLVEEPLVCMGRKCYLLTFVGWGCISVVGAASSVMLFLRTRPAYFRFERSQMSTISLSEF